MKVQGEHHFQASREDVWKAVLDPQVLASSLPGFQRLDAIGENEYEGALEIKVGPVQGNFQGTLELSDLQEPSSYRFRLNGMGAAGFVDGEGLLVLEEAGGGTKLLYDLDAKVGGRIAGVGQRLLDSSAKVLARQTLEGIEQHFPQAEPEGVAEAGLAQEAPASDAAADEAPAGEPASEAAPAETEAPAAAGAPPAQTATRVGRAQAAPAPPSQFQFALAFAKGLAGELVPPSKRPWVITGGLILYTVLVVLLTRACSG